MSFFLSHLLSVKLLQSMTPSLCSNDLLWFWQFANLPCGKHFTHMKQSKKFVEQQLEMNWNSPSENILMNNDQSWKTHLQVLSLHANSQLGTFTFDAREKSICPDIEKLQLDVPNLTEGGSHNKESHTVFSFHCCCSQQCSYHTVLVYTHGRS